MNCERVIIELDVMTDVSHGGSSLEPCHVTFCQRALYYFLRFRSIKLSRKYWFKRARLTSFFSFSAADIFWSQ